MKKAPSTRIRIFWKTHLFYPFFVRDTISESLSDFLLKSQLPVEALWSLRSIDLRVIALHPSFVNSRMPQNASLVLLISEPIRVNAFSFVIHKRGKSQYPEQVLGSRPHGDGVFGHRKRSFSKALSRVDLFENAVFLLSCGRVKTELFENADITASI